MSHHPLQYSDLQRHGYQPMDSHSAYQTHSMVSGGMPQIGAAGYRLPRSLSSSPGPYVSSIPFTASASSHPPQGIVTQASSIFGQPHASPYSGYTTTPTAGYASSQYPGVQGQRYDISQYYGVGTGGNFFNTGSYGLPPSSSQSSNVGNPSGQSGQGGQGGAPPPTGQGHMRRHSPPDPRYGNPPQ